LATSLGGISELSFWRTARGLVPAWISVVASTSS